MSAIHSTLQTLSLTVGVRIVSLPKALLGKQMCF